LVWQGGIGHLITFLIAAAAPATDRNGYDQAQPGSLMRVRRGDSIRDLARRIDHVFHIDRE
jgi:hypothetical protein